MLPSTEDLRIIIGETTAQDVLLDLGAPIRKYWKEDDRIATVWGSHELEDGNGGDGDCESAN